MVSPGKAISSSHFNTSEPPEKKKKIDTVDTDDENLQLSPVSPNARKDTRKQLFGNTKKHTVIISSESEYDEAEDTIIDEVPPLACDALEIKPNDFILVKVVGGKRGKQTYNYLCIVEKIDTKDEVIYVMELRSTDKLKTTFTPKENDKFVCPFNDLIGILPMPEFNVSNRSFKYTFEGSVPVKEM
uniref:Uncharacterized protein n=1 Tax=Cacopsylla melanoneura TaxID=428564 RepID=A0A8D8ZCA1_9HEMI